MNTERIMAIKKSLDEINFKKILHEKEYVENGSHNYKKEKPGNSQHEYCEEEPYCTLCDTEWNIPKQEIEGIDYKLSNVSHGTHTLDFLHAAEGYEGTEAICKLIENWDDRPVLFLFENPSIDYDIYTKGEKWNAKKRPPTRWYWIYDSDLKKEVENKYISSLKKKKYGAMVFALIRIFKLSNAYMTNVVKCGMNDVNNENKFLTTKHYKPECINTCVNKILLEEITELTCGNTEPLTVFAFGRRTQHLICSALRTNEYKKFKDRTQVVYMPHPASHNISNNNRKNFLLDEACKSIFNNSFQNKDDKLLNLISNMKNVILE